MHTLKMFTRIVCWYCATGHATGCATVHAIGHAIGHATSCATCHTTGCATGSKCCISMAKICQKSHVDNRQQR